jgi:hypothetical protein
VHGIDEKPRGERLVAGERGVERQEDEQAAERDGGRRAQRREPAK